MSETVDKPLAARVAEALGTAYTLEGEIGRGSMPVESQPAAAAQPFTSRMDLIGAGAEGTGGRTSPSQQPTTEERSSVTQ